MKVTVLGANGAFSVGKHDNMISVTDLGRVLEALKQPQNNTEEIVKQFVKRAYVPTWQSNFLIEFDMPGRVNKDVFRFVLDFGGDIRHSLQNVGLNINQIDAWYASHPHNDHIGGTEAIGLMTFFNPFFNDIKNKWLAGESVTAKVEREQMPGSCKPLLIGHQDVLRDLWHTARAGLETLEGIRNVSIDTYFDVVSLDDKSQLTYKEKNGVEWNLYTVISVHVLAGSGIMNSYGLMFEGTNGRKIYFPTDSQFMSPKQIRKFYDKVDVVYQDCETSPFPSDVHPHITDLKTLPANIKKKMLLYHYQETPTVGKHIDKDEFGAVLKMGDVQEY
jgi:L-ascorbate metabolism protein UlaG (beta-lactamase superfamily)